MPLAFRPDIVEGKVYRSKKKQEGDDEKQALRELQTILASRDRRSCDCEAQIHDLLQNCLGCGRLTCTSEGSGKCFSCGNIVLSQDQRLRLEKHIDIPHSNKAISNNDQPGKSRTAIIDNQFDHFAIDNKKHLKEEDRRKLKEDLLELQARRYQRKLILNVNVDQLEAGSESMPEIDDYEVELRKLQLSQQTNESSSKFTLTELVQEELKNDYNFEYISPVELKKKRPSTSSDGVAVKISDSSEKQKQPKQSNPGPNQIQRKSKKANKEKPPKSAWKNNNNKAQRE